MRGITHRIQNYIIAITWCHAVYIRDPDAEAGNRRYNFVIGFWTEDEAVDYVNAQLADE